MLDYIRIGCAVPDVTVADVQKNTREICGYIAEADAAGCTVVVFPELALTGYTCGDLFFQQLLHEAVQAGLRQIAACSAEYPNVTVVVGLPLMLEGTLFNCAAVLSGGTVRGIVPKSFLPNYAETEERRWFGTAAECKIEHIRAGALGLAEEYAVPVGAGLVFTLDSGVKLGVEICEDLFAPASPSSAMALQGAEVIANPAASPQIAGKQAYRRKLVTGQSENGRCVYAFCSAGCGESTRDLVFSGHSVIAQQGKLLAENQKLVDSGYLLTADADMGAVRAQRCRDSSFRSAAAVQPVCVCGSGGAMGSGGELTVADRLPFVTGDEAEAFEIQAAALAQRLKWLKTKAVVGVSGGLDSTLALLVAVEAMYRLGRPASDVYAVTMPGFGTTDRTYDNAIKLMALLGVTVKEISICDAVTQHFADIGHDVSVHDLTYENAQARERTQILMDYAGKIGGIVVGTGDLSELALGWCTYNGDHMSMYGVNASIPKTLIPEVIRAAAKLPRYEAAEAVLRDVIDTPISPELLPPDAQGNIAQQTEDVVGPYILHDFFLYHTLKCGFTPKKIFALACRAFAGEFAPAVIKKWLKVFYRRFFSQQFKRNCMPEGVKVCEVSLSPRGDWRMPGDASAALWLAEIEKL